jgi:putative tricarboxylic transport membrane protein
MPLAWPYENVHHRSTSNLEDIMKMTKERWGSLFFLVVGAYGIIFSLRLPFGKWSNPGPAMFPLALAVLLFISGVLWFLLGKGSEGEEAGKTSWRELIKDREKAVKIVFIIAGFILSLERLGYLLTATLFAFVLLAWISRYHIWIAACLAIGIGVGSWLFFGKLLSVQFPRGLIPL